MLHTFKIKAINKKNEEKNKIKIKIKNFKIGNEFPTILDVKIYKIFVLYLLNDL